MNSEIFENVQICLDLSFLCRPEYKLFRVETLQYYVVLYCQHLGFYFGIFLNFKMSIFKNFKNRPSPSRLFLLMGMTQT
jgi:hypothetical protein